MCGKAGSTRYMRWGVAGPILTTPVVSSPSAAAVSDDISAAQAKPLKAQAIGFNVLSSFSAGFHFD